MTGGTIAPAPPSVDPAAGVRPATRAGPAPVRVPRFRVAGVPISELTFDEALELFLQAPARGDRLRAHFCTAQTVVEAHDTPALGRVLAGADLAAADGMPLAWVGRLRGRHVGRVCGPDVMLALLDRSRERGGRHYFYGGAQGTPERIADRMRERFPGLQVVGTESPPFRALTPLEQQEAADRINASGADYVWVGLGTPKQDLWLAENRARLDAAVLFAVGAAFDFLSGGKPRAPRLMQRTGTEWLFRLVTEPRRLVRRYTVTNARFLWLVGLEILRRPRRQAQRS